MAKRTLATDFKDDILAESMDGKRRYRLVANGDGTYCLEDASVYEQTGSIYGAKQVNEANEAINSSADAAKIIDDIDAVLANTVGGYMAGAMAVRGLDGKLKTVAKTGSYNDLTDKPTIPSGAAANYGVADNDTTNSAASLVTARVAYEHGAEIDSLSERLPDGVGIEWDGTNFYGTTTDGVKKKLGDPDFKVLDCGLVSWKEHEFGQWHHGYHFTKVSEIPDFGSMVHGKDFFIEVYNGGTEQTSVGIGIGYVSHSNSELVMTSVNGLNSLALNVYYAVK
nr:MAG TPA: hypothetical protein [Caudoviricetes sp.]